MLNLKSSTNIFDTQSGIKLPEGTVKGRLSFKEMNFFYRQRPDKMVNYFNNYCLINSRHEIIYYLLDASTRSLVLINNYLIIQKKTLNLFIYLLMSEKSFPEEGSEKK